MVLIRLSAHHKIAEIVTMILFVVCFLIFATGAVSRSAEYAHMEPNSKDDISITQSYESDKRYECAPKTESETDNTTTAAANDDDDDDDANEPAEEDLYIRYYTEQDAIDIAKVLYHECRGVSSKTEQACVAWTILNRVDCYASSVYDVVRAPNQFAFYENAPVWNELLDLANDVLDRWSREKNGEQNIGRVLPPEYIYFYGQNGHNYFRDNYVSSYNVWGYSAESPYEN